MPSTPDSAERLRDLEARGRARATVARRRCTVAGFYRYAEQEGLLARSPAAHVHRPRLDYESHATGLDRNEVGALLVAAAPELTPSPRTQDLGRRPSALTNVGRHRCPPACTRGGRH